MLEYLECFWFLIGLWTIIKASLSVLNSFKSLISKANYSLYGLKSWALITGPTDGIGFAFAEHLASQGFNIVLVGRNPEKLKTVAKSLEERFPISTKSIIKDFSLAPNNPSDFFQDIKNQTQGLDISVLVNNVGAGTGTNYFHKLQEKYILNANSLNLWPIVFLTKLYLPDLTSRKNRSAIINLASVQSIFKLPFNSGYSAGKSFDDLFTLIVNEEAKYICKGKDTNIDVLSLRPGYVDTPLTKNTKGRILLISAQECASNACKTLGSVNYTNGHWKHLLLATFIGLMPDLVSTFMKKKISKGLAKTN